MLAAAPRQIIYCAAGIWGYLARMDWQQLVSLLIVGAAGALLVGSKLRRKRFSWERDTHCGCVGATGASNPSTIVFRARKGQRPEVRVKMK